MRKKSDFIIQGGILCSSRYFVTNHRELQDVFPMEHIIGDVGNGYYSATYEVHAMMLIISCYSLPLAVPKVDFLPRLEETIPEMQTGLSSVL